MRTKAILITGANGEVGHGLIRQLAEMGGMPPVIVLDIRGLDEVIRPMVYETKIGDILDTNLLENLINEYEIVTIYHLAALLSTNSEFNPEVAHRVNVQGTVNLLHLATVQSRLRGAPVQFIFPSSIAIYGLPDLKTKTEAGAIPEDHYNAPTTMYGCNKLYCEHLGRYYTFHYQQLAATPTPGVDFRAVRFPGLISALTTPTGGTSDYAPEMVHAAAQGLPYKSFVREDSQIPFMVMPDAIAALLKLARTPAENLSRRVYNVTAFSPSAADIHRQTIAAFPGAEITYEPHLKRQAIVDSWPVDIDDRAARADWGWKPEYDFERGFGEYLIPRIHERYHR